MRFAMKRFRSSLAAAAALTVLPLAQPAHATIVAEPVYDQAPGASISLEALGSYDTGQFDESAAEIVAYHAATKRLFTVNAQSGSIDVLDVSDPAKPVNVGAVNAGADTTINSVAVRADGLAVAAVEPANKTEPGELMFFDAGALDVGADLGRVAVGSLPDMVTITPDGDWALVANEGEPAEDYSVDPEGSVGVVKLPDTVTAPAQSDVRTAGFGAFEGKLAEGVQIFGQVGASTTEAQNLEPEYIATAGGKAYVTLQENNAVAVVDIDSATVEEVFPLGYIDRTKVPFDPSDKDSAIISTDLPVKAMPQPDSIAAHTVGGQTYLVMANEGDARDWDAYKEEARIEDFGNAKKNLQPLCEGFGGMTAEEIAAFKSDDKAGRLKVTTSRGLNKEKNCFDELYTFGGRSFSVYTAGGERVFDSGAAFEEITARALPNYFNSDHAKAGVDDRSDDKGPEPEGLTIGQVGGRTYAFIGFERIGGIIVYDITDPKAPVYQAYINNRNFASNAGDLGPEGLTFIPAADAPNGEALLAVGNEVSGSTTLFRVAQLDDAPAAPPASSGSSTGGIVVAVLGAFLAAVAVFGVAAKAAFEAGVLPAPVADLIRTVTGR